MTEHLDLPQLASFAARYHLAHQIRSSLGQSADELKVLDGIKSEANKLSMKRCGLGESFTSLNTAIMQQSAAYRANISPELSAKLDSLCRTLDEHSCYHCTVTEACKHGEKTYLKVAEGGKCIKPVKCLVSNLKNWIENLWQPLPKDTYDIVFATTGHAFHDSHQPLMLKFALGGYALSLGDQGKYRTKVGLMIREDSFDWEQYSLLPYILIHEILCHAFQSLDNPTLRENADADDPWSEGWMDSLAHSLALEWLANAENAPVKTPDEIDFARAQTTQLHNARYATPALAALSGPAFGRQVFNIVRTCYLPKFKNLPISKHPITRFSLRLNSVTMRMRDRNAILEAMRVLTPNDPARLRQIIGDFVAHRDDQVAVERLRSALR